MQRIGDTRWMGLLMVNHAAGAHRLRYLLLMAAFAAGVLAVMNPRRAGAALPVSKKGIDIVIALDVSRSMLATDLAPSRLERAKQFLGKFLSAMPDDRVALVVFAGQAYLQMPFTNDQGAARLFIAGADPSQVPQQGTVISDALAKSARAFSASTEGFKTLLLITDGEDHDEAALATAKDLAKEGVMINCIGIGSPEGTTIPDPLTGGNKKDDAGNTVVSRLNETLLKELAAETQGVYTRLQGSEEAVAVLKQQLAGIGRKKFTDLSQLSFRSYYWVFAGLMLLLLLPEIFITERKKIPAV